MKNTNKETVEQSFFYAKNLFNDWRNIEIVSHAFLAGANWREQNPVNAIPENDGWISCKHKLPKNKQKILMYCEREYKGSAEIVTGYYETGDYENFISYDFHEDEMPIITHWRPLPSPPKV